MEIIFKSSWLNSGIEYGKTERVLRVNNTQKALAIYEEYRETVMNKASKLPKKHPRCFADGNEMLRFHGSGTLKKFGLHFRGHLHSLNDSLKTFARQNVELLLNAAFFHLTKGEI